MSEASRVQAIAEARARRAGLVHVDEIRTQSYIADVVNTITLKVSERTRLATEYLQSCVVKNINRPVTKTPTTRIATRVVKGVTYKKGSQYTKVTDRSVAGEFPKADTTLLLTGIFNETWEDPPGCFNGGVGTPTDYGVILETNEALDRKFLTRTLNDERETIIQILSGPVG